MIFSLILVTDRTFSFMSIFEDFSPIVVMLTKVVWDLKVFLLFYTILISLFSIIACVIGYGNSNPGLNLQYYKEFGAECLGDLPDSAKSESCEEN